MKALHLISGGDVGGAKTHVLSLLNSLGRERASLLCFREGEFADEARALGIDTRICSDGLIKCVSIISNMIKKEGFDVIHCHGSRANFVGSLIKLRVNVPFVTTVHSDYKLDYLGRPLARMTYGVLNSLALRRMDYYIGVSDAMAELLISRNFPPHKIFTIYNGIDFNVKAEPLERNEFFQSHGISADSSWVIAGIAARLNPVKDIKTLIRAAAIACESCPNLHLAIAGDGEQLQMLTLLASELGIADRVHFLGWVNDMFSFYNSIDINLLTSLSETFPYALTEGTRFSLPAISSRVGGVAKLIVDGECGYLFEPGDFTSLAKHLCTLYNDNEKRINMGKSLAQRAKELFSLERTRDTQIAIYTSILRKHANKISKNRCGVTICGAYGQKNSGDDAILESIILKLRTHDRDIPINVMTRSPKATAKSYRVKTVFTFNPIAYRRAMRASALFLDGGGSLIQNVTSRRSLWFYLHTIKTAKKLGCKVMMYGCGIGPVNGEKDRDHAAKILNSYVDTITLREDHSLSELQSLGVTNPKIILSADPALSLPCPSKQDCEYIIRSFGLESKEKYICFVLRPWTGLSKKVADIAAAAEYCYKKYGLKSVFLSINSDLDERACDAVVAKMNTPFIKLSKLNSSENVIAILSCMSALVSMRLHGLIFAAGHAVPLIGIVYDPKVSSFLQYIGQNNSIELNELNTEVLTEAIDFALKSDTSAQIESARALSELENKNIEAVFELLR